MEQHESSFHQKRKLSVVLLFFTVKVLTKLFISLQILAIKNMIPHSSEGVRSIFFLFQYMFFYSFWTICCKSTQLAELVKVVWPGNTAYAINDAHRNKLRFTQFSTKIYRNRKLAAFDLFHLLTQSFKFYTFHCHILQSTDVWTRWFINPWNKQKKWTVAPFSDFYGIIWIGFCLNRKTLCCIGVILKPQDKT